MQSTKTVYNINLDVKYAIFFKQEQLGVKAQPTPRQQNGSFSIPDSHSYLAYGLYTVQVTIQDTINGLSSSASASLSVTNPISLTIPTTQNKTEGNSVSLSYHAQALDPSGATTCRYPRQLLPQPAAGSVRFPCKS